MTQRLSVMHAAPMMVMMLTILGMGRQMHISLESNRLISSNCDDH